MYAAHIMCLEPVIPVPRTHQAQSSPSPAHPSCSRCRSLISLSLTGHPPAPPHLHTTRSEIALLYSPPPRSTHAATLLLPHARTTWHSHHHTPAAPKLHTHTDPSPFTIATSIISTSTSTMDDDATPPPRSAPSSLPHLTSPHLHSVTQGSQYHHLPASETLIAPKP